MTIASQAHFMRMTALVLEILWFDIRLALRGWLASKAYARTAIVTLVLTISVLPTTFTIVDSVLLLIGALNVTGIQIGRNTSKEGDFAVYAALGCSRRRVVCQQIVETTLVAG